MELAFFINLVMRLLQDLLLPFKGPITAHQLWRRHQSLSGALTHLAEMWYCTDHRLENRKVTARPYCTGIHVSCAWALTVTRLWVEPVTTTNCPTGIMWAGFEKTSLSCGGKSTEDYGTGCNLSADICHSTTWTNVKVDWTLRPELKS